MAFFERNQLAVHFQIFHKNESISPHGLCANIAYNQIIKQKICISVVVVIRKKTIEFNITSANQISMQILLIEILEFFDNRIDVGEMKRKRNSHRPHTHTLCVCVCDNCKFKRPCCCCRRRRLLFFLFLGFVCLNLTKVFFVAERIINHKHTTNLL